MPKSKPSKRHKSKVISFHNRIQQKKNTLNKQLLTARIEGLNERKQAWALEEATRINETSSDDISMSHMMIDAQ